MEILSDKLTIKKCLVFVTFALFFTITSNAQDLITKTDNSTIQCKVTKVSSTEVEYKKWSNLDGPTYIISISDVSNINYQNGDVDEFIQQSQLIVSDTISGIMSRSGNDLLLDGILLSDSEVLNLLGEQGYDTYVNAKKQLSVGEISTFFFAISIVGDIVGITGMINGKDSDAIMKSALVFYVSFIATNVFTPLMCVFYGIGNGRMNRLVEGFNQKHNKTMTFSAAPSLMNCEMPQLQNKYGLGVTLRANF